jgi:hypothetical protein
MIGKAALRKRAGRYDLEVFELTSGWVVKHMLNGWTVDLTTGELVVTWLDGYCTAIRRQRETSVFGGRATA